MAGQSYSADQISGKIMFQKNQNYQNEPRQLERVVIASGTIVCYGNWNNSI